ncbi:MAG: ABC transporter permease subunit [Planctomycetales bacterium]
MRIKFALLALLVATVPLVARGQDVVVGSKKFTESVILGEMLAHLAHVAGARVEHKSEMGGTRLLWNALLSGEIDAYPDYTGTIDKNLFPTRDLSDLAKMREALAEHGVLMTDPLGFDNGYAMGMTEKTAAKHNVKTISDLAKHPELRLGFSHEFIDRSDGWRGLQPKYGLPQKTPRSLDHDLAYRALREGNLDVMEIYITDAEIQHYQLRVIKDDLAFFPTYQGVILYREDLAEKAPRVLENFLKLQDAIPTDRMRELNYETQVDRQSEFQVAQKFLAMDCNVISNRVEETAFEKFLRNTGTHLFMVVVSLSAAVVVSIPVGIYAARHERIGQFILGVVGLFQTIPSLALFVFLIALGFPIGEWPTITALFLYSLLPIVRNTYAGLSDIPIQMKESAHALGLSEWARLRLIELPLAARSILAGIKTSAIINVGTATIGAVVGAGGYGRPILRGIRTMDLWEVLIQGAIPAAALALVVQILFEVSERFVVPKGLRLKRSE